MKTSNDTLNALAQNVMLQYQHPRLDGYTGSLTQGAAIAVVYCDLASRNEFGVVDEIKKESLSELYQQASNELKANPGEYTVTLSDQTKYYVSSGSKHVAVIDEIQKASHDRANSSDQYGVRANAPNLTSKPQPYTP